MTEHINITNSSAEEILDYLRKGYKYNKVIYDEFGDDILYFSKLTDMSTQEKEKWFQELADKLRKDYL